MGKQSYTVYHKKQSDFFSVPDKINPKDYESVAVVETEGGLEQVYFLTNSIDYHWSKNKGIHLLIGDRLRSTSVGDLIIENAQDEDSEERVFVVDRVGFKEVTFDFE